MSDQEVAAEDLFPIRELCARTQLNSVTIRAWERRYGLLKPKRTSKGHRLYSESDVKRVEQIVEWIGRGVPVSRVKALLDGAPGGARSSSEADAEAAVGADATLVELINQDHNDWRNAIDTLCGAVLEMSADKTEHCLNECFLNYPAATCGEKLLEPVFNSLQAAPIGTAAQAFLQSEIVAYVIQRSAAGKHMSRTTDLQLICGDNTPIWRLAISALSLSDAGVRVQLINQPCNVSVWVDLVRSNHHQAQLVFQDGIWREEEIHRIESILKPALLKPGSFMPALWLCGAAPMTSGITDPDSHNQPVFFPTPESAVASIIATLNDGQRR